MDLHPGEEIVFEGHPSWRALLVFYVSGLLVAAVALVIGVLASGWGLGILLGAVVFAVLVVVGLVKRMATRYVLTTERLHIRRGLLSKRTQETRVQRVQNVNTDQTLFQRVMRVGTVDFDTAGTDDSEFRFVGVANPAEVVRAVDRAQRAAAAPAASPSAPDNL
ncbi:MAG TPA: PH domain-containing protein [Solirubrobacteraceae bacterium]|nr:PH domain-containing protein [Solirubrobacteraceae bacterium]